MASQRKTIYLVVLNLFVASIAMGAGVDVNSVILRGDGADYGMWINFVDVNDAGFDVVTNGARFIFDANNSSLRVYQRIGKRRFVASVSIADSPQNIKLLQNTPDHVVMEADTFYLAIYGDSTCIMASRQDGMNIKCVGAFKPSYAGQRLGEVIFIDDVGGVSVLPQRHESGYELLQMKRFQKDWVLEYVFKRGQRLMLSVFPPRNYDQQKSYTERFVFTNGVIIDQFSTGTLVDNQTLAHWRKYVNNVVLLNGGLYHGRNDWEGYIYPGKPYAYTCGGPYEPVNPDELKRVVNAVHKLGYKVSIYVSPFYHYKSPDADVFFEDAKNVYDKFDLDGFYIDGLYMDWSQGTKCEDDKIKNYELIRRLRKLVGPEGILFYHGSGDRSEVAAVPNIDALCDFVLYGETVKFNSFQDDYVKFQVKKRGISNTIGMVRPNRSPQFSKKTVIDEMLKMDNRERWSCHPRMNSYGKRYWPDIPPLHLIRYFKILDALQKGVALEDALKIE